jgi:hypothetical protein
MRVRWDNYQDTPYPAETPAGQNPPDGAIIDYFLQAPASGELTLTIYDDKGAEVTKFSSAAPQANFLPANVPSYWFAPEPVLSKTAGVNRFVWDLRYPAPASLPYSYYGKLLDYAEYTLADHAIPGHTPRQQPRGPLVAPGTYTAELRYGGQTLRQQLTVTLDPRVHASPQDLVEQRDVALAISRGMKSTYDLYEQVAALQKAFEERQKNLQNADKATKESMDKLAKEIDAVAKGTKTAPGFGPVNRELSRLISSVENADMRPTPAVQAAVEQSCDSLDKDLSRWTQLNEQDVKSFNETLAQSKLPALPIASGITGGCKK